MLLNGAFWHEQAARFADRLRCDAGDQMTDQVHLAFRLALARPPSADELTDSLEFLTSHARLVQSRPDPADRPEPELEALRALCLVLLNCNEFVTVD